MRIDIVTLLPEIFPAYLGASILGRAQQGGLARVVVHDLRDYGIGKHRITDEPPYGGGGGMILKPEPIFAAVEAILPNEDLSEPSAEGETSKTPVILLTPQGRPFNQEIAHELVGLPGFILVCGRYEGVDERVRQHLATDELSIGDYILTGGELAALIVTDAVVRLLPGALGDESATGADSFAAGLLEHPHYTRPERMRQWSVPEILRSGHAANIAQWRRRQALRRTWERRPDLLLKAQLDEADRHFLADLANERVDHGEG
ncbi:MAG: tRNA (guanosine(37)-N1)-methyltransferase TrmD [Candidatus Promineifilaceae bacterium]|nr:tRNA (guanosine(37)-N1)-methyltransferase TrmD [Candidatus Promineifilaceae bacterium]